MSALAKQFSFFLLGLFGAFLPPNIFAQIQIPLDVTASKAMRLADQSTPVVGDNPAGIDFGFSPKPGGLIQILDVGENGQPDSIRLDGEPGGDDFVVGTAQVGEGVAPNRLDSGLFSVSIFPPPRQGAQLFARVFDAPSLNASTVWSQSGTFQVQGSEVMDVSRLGITAVMQPLGVDAESIDSDGDGLSNADELVANTDPLDPAGLLKTRLKGLDQVLLKGEIGRRYRLHRTTSDLNAGLPIWEPVAESPVLSEESPLELLDPDPPADAQRVYYRVEVELP